MQNGPMKETNENACRHFLLNPNGVQQNEPLWSGYIRGIRNMPKKRILLVHNFYQIGGGEHTVFENEKKLLQKNGHMVLDYTRSNDELKASKWKLLLMPLTTLWSWRTFFQVRRLIRDGKIDVVHCHNTFPLISPSVYYAARSLKIPVVQTIHNFRFLCPNGLCYRDGKICEECLHCNSFLPALKHRCYRDSLVQTAVVAAMLTLHRWMGTYRKINYSFLTEFNKSKFSGLMDIHADNVFVKPNFVYRPDVSIHTGEVKKKFIFAGRLDAYKGISFLLDVWPELPKDYELHIYGDGAFREACEAAAQRYENIRFFGFRPQQEIQEDLSDAAALVFPSLLYETFPMTLSESFSMGCPVLAADLGNHGDLLRASRGGIAYAPGDRESFRRAVERILRDNKQLSTNARNYFDGHLSEDRNYEMLSEIYDKAKHIQ